jgi:HK97 family phage portal protein
MGWLDIFKARKEVITGFDFDDLERIFGSLYLKSLAVDKSAEFVARIFAKSEFRYMVKNKHERSNWDYLLNVRPNRNESASEFWQKVIYRLLTKNEVLIILSDDDQLLVADSFTRKRYAVYDDTFEMVSVRDYTFQRKFAMSDVIFLQYNNNRLQEYMSDLFADYEKLHSRLVEALGRNNQIRGILNTKTNGTFNEERLKQMQEYADGLFKSFTKKSVAIVPAQNGLDYNELTNTVGTSNLSVDELKKLRRQFDDEVADILGIPTALMHGDMANLENSQKMFTSYCYKSLVKKVSDGLNHAMVGPDAYAEERFFVIIGEGQRDKFALAENIDKLISSGAMLINEVRAELGLEAVPWGDKPVMTKNYQVGKEIEKGGEKEDEGDSN